MKRSPLGGRIELMADPLRRNLPNALTILRLLIAAAFFATISLSVFRGELHEQSRQIWGNIAVALFIAFPEIITWLPQFMD